MSQPGRKRKFRGYDPASSTQSKLNELNAREAKKARLHVLNQPHRRGAKDPEHPWLASALGRLCLAEGLDKALYEAGEEYRELVARFQAAWGIDGRQQDGTTGSASADGPSARIVHAWQAMISKIEQGWARAGVRATMWLLLRDDFDLPVQANPQAILGLQALGEIIGIWQPERSDQSDESPMRMRPLAGM